MIGAFIGSLPIRLVLRCLSRFEPDLRCRISPGTKKAALLRRPVFINVVRLIAHFHFAASSHDDLNFVIAALPTDRRNFSTQKSFVPLDTRRLVQATNRNLNTCFVFAAQWIHQTHVDLDAFSTHWPVGANHATWFGTDTQRCVMARLCRQQS